ncbi:MAG: sigma-54 dependent transcriptional regulator [Cellvibrionaceae bacterium]|nr:sigma-54 dependent transcriptional regulator [Cellvibrionaceae bacterium]
MNKILIVEDEAIIRMALRKLLERHGYDVREAGSVKEATSKHNVDNYDIIISDLRLPGEQGTALIDLAANTPVLIMTSYASLRSAVDSMRMGAVDYIAKPFDHQEMLDTVKRILEDSNARYRNTADSQSRDTHSGEMIGDSAIMQDLYKRIEQVAPTDATVLIHGETGTGKELAARAIHTASQRNKHPLICINCAAIPENLIESELFGHEKGAFTGAANSRDGLVLAANGGSLFLDEIGELPMEAQARLLRVLQEGEVRPVGSVDTRKVDVRLIAATHRDLNQRCKEGLFREDLYFRLNVIQLQIPPLRNRGKDILNLAEALITRYAAAYNKPRSRLSIEAIKAINTYQWPGNVRELENAIQRAIILCEQGQDITHDLLALDSSTENTSPSDNKQPSDSGVSPAAEAPENLSLEDYFQHFVIENQDSMSETELAKQLGVSRKCLWERRQKFGIPRTKAGAKK